MREQNKKQEEKRETMIITALHTEGILTFTCIVNGGLLERDKVNLSLAPNATIYISDAFSTCQELIDAENAGLISTTGYETGDLTTMNKEKTIEVVERDVTYSVNVTNSSLDVALQDQTTENLNLRFCTLLNTVTVASNTSIDDMTITLVAGHNFVVGNTLCLKEDDRKYQGLATDVNGNIISLDSPLDYAFTTSSNASRTTHDLDVNGSVTPVIFNVSPVGLDSDVAWDITRIIFHLQGENTMDDGLFGDMAALTNGLFVRYKDSTHKNILNAKTNGGFLDFCNSGAYDDRASSKGVYGFRCIKVFGGQENDGVVIRLHASTNDELQVIVQDDLTSLTEFHVSAIGHRVD